MRSWLQRQASSREKLRDAAAGYVKMRAGDGSYEDVLAATDREGRKVTVFIKLEIISDEG